MKIKTITLIQSIRYLCIIPLLLATTLPIRAAIVYFDIPDQTLETSAGANSMLYIDLDATSVSESFTTADAFSTLSLSSTGYELAIGLNDNGDLWSVTDGHWQGIAVFTENGPYAKRYHHGETISITITDISLLPIDAPDTDDSFWSNDTGQETKYIAYYNNDISDVRAWIGLQYNDALNQVTITGFASGTASEGLTAGAVPEPAETSLAMILAAGSFAVFKRFKRSQQIAT